jgi:hypothetical protein
MAYFQTKIPIWANFGGLAEVGKFYDHLVYLVAIWYIW